MTVGYLLSSSTSVKTTDFFFFFSIHHHLSFAFLLKNPSALIAPKRTPVSENVATIFCVDGICLNLFPLSEILNGDILWIAALSGV